MPRLNIVVNFSDPVDFENIRVKLVTAVEAEVEDYLESEGREEESDAITVDWDTEEEVTV